MASQCSNLTEETAIDRMLAAALRGESPEWPSRLPAGLSVERVLYHGVSGLIAKRAPELDGWPTMVLAPVRKQAIAQAMWEMQHKPLLAGLLLAFAENGITALLLKGSAMAYDLYQAPASRSRGDSDVLVAPENLDQARRVLERLGFGRGIDEEIIADNLALQEVWSAPGAGGNRHCIDLHWQLLNSPALGKLMEFEACAADRLDLPRLGPGAIAMSRVLTLLHTCIHRAMHITSPYFVDGATYYGGDRLIWLNDIDLLASALSDAEWDTFTTVALRLGFAIVALNGLETAHRALRTNIPPLVRQRLGEADCEEASAYLLFAGQALRSWRDFRAVSGWRQRLAYAAGRVLPSSRFMRTKYPEMRTRPLVALYARRMIDLIRPRPARSKRG